MRTISKLCLLTIIIMSMSCKEEYPDLKDGLYAKFKTNYGEFIAELYYKKTPMTVGNFVSLAEGTNPKVSEEYKGKKFYDSLIFHRVMKDFMIQGGDPLGSGMGDPGYKFPDETTPELKHDTLGILSMANSGPNTNGSQFFITHKPTPWLDGKHTVFGKISEGFNIVDSIANAEVAGANKPVEDVVIETIEIIRKGKEAKSYDAVSSFVEPIEDLEAKKEKEIEEFKNKMASIQDSLQETESGLKYIITQENPSGTQPESGQTVYVHYEGRLSDGKMFDSSYKRNQPLNFAIGTGRVIPGWDEGISLLKTGEKATLIIPPDLGYGARGAGNVIPPNSTLVFDVELVDVK
jgi:peptidylprolyl isomerase